MNYTIFSGDVLSPLVLFPTQTSSFCFSAFNGGTTFQNNQKTTTALVQLMGRFGPELFGPESFWPILVGQFGLIFSDPRLVT